MDDKTRQGIQHEVRERYSSIARSPQDFLLRPLALLWIRRFLRLAGIYPAGRRRQRPRVWQSIGFGRPSGRRDCTRPGVWRGTGCLAGGPESGRAGYRLRVGCQPRHA